MVKIAINTNDVMKKSIFFIIMFILYFSREGSASEIVNKPIKLEEVISESNIVIIGRCIDEHNQVVHGTFMGVEIKFKLLIKHFAVEEILIQDDKSITKGQIIYVYDTGEFEMKKQASLYKKGISLTTSLKMYEAPKRFSRINIGERIFLFLSNPQTISTEKEWNPWKNLTLPDLQEALPKQKILWQLVYPRSFESIKRKDEIIKLLPKQYK